MFSIARYLWRATRGHRIAPWRSPYLRWRIETYSGRKMAEIGARQFWEFCWQERGELVRFLRWAAQMPRWARGKATRGMSWPL